MAEYWGLDKIAERIGVCRDTIYRMMERDGLPIVYRRVNLRPGRTAWIDDGLLNLWWCQQAKVSQGERPQKYRTRVPRKASDAPRQRRQPATPRDPEPGTPW